MNKMFCFFYMLTFSISLQPDNFLLSLKHSSYPILCSLVCGIKIEITQHSLPFRENFQFAFSANEFLSFKISYFNWKTETEFEWHFHFICFQMQFFVCFGLTEKAGKNDEKSRTLLGDTFWIRLMPLDKGWHRTRVTCRSLINSYIKPKFFSMTSTQCFNATGKKNQTQRQDYILIMKSTNFLLP